MANGDPIASSFENLISALCKAEGKVGAARAAARGKKADNSEPKKSEANIVKMAKEEAPKSGTKPSVDLAIMIKSFFQDEDKKEREEAQKEKRQPLHDFAANAKKNTMKKKRRGGRAKRS